MADAELQPAEEREVVIWVCNHSDLKPWKDFVRDAGIFEAIKEIDLTSLQELCRAFHYSIYHHDFGQVDTLDKLGKVDRDSLIIRSVVNAIRSHLEINTNIN